MPDRELGTVPGSAGRVMPNTELRISEHGELLLRGPQTMDGYLNRLEATAELIDEEGWVHTGDLGRIDADGFVWISGRAGDVINRGGNKVFPEDVEETLRLHPLVADAAVVGRADDRLGEVPVAYVELAAGATVDAANVASELEARCRRELTAYKVPVSFEVIDALPRNDAGKVVRNALR
jgi:acyl-CoA synthetase (AMP-forming)/AMP-acid ligase II